MEERRVEVKRSLSWGYAGAGENLNSEMLRDRLQQKLEEREGDSELLGIWREGEGVGGVRGGD